LTNADVVIGNSSSGVIEAPAVGTPTVNIGSRQEGRLRSSSIIDVPNTREGISDGLRMALSPAFQELARTQKPVFGKGGASKIIAETLATVPLDHLITKTFWDLPSKS
jgi:UDP-N-acetylglucosamine 2-epimerase